MVARMKPAGGPQGDAWRGFAPGEWQHQVNVREFIQCNYTPYEGDSSFLQGATQRTLDVWHKLQPRLEGILKGSEPIAIKILLDQQPRTTAVSRRCHQVSGRKDRTLI
jgi:pyruvate-formate lyase